MVDKQTFNLQEKEWLIDNPDNIKMGRTWLMDYLGKCKGKILFVGVNSYTKEYYKFVPNPELFETVDICPKRGKKGGSPHKHHICDFKQLNIKEHQYDHIILNGIDGFQGYEIHNDSIFLDTRPKYHCYEQLELLDPAEANIPKLIKMYISFFNTLMLRESQSSNLIPVLF